MDRPTDFPARASSRKQGRDRRREGGGHSRTVPTFVTATFLGLLVVGAPLALGAVHRTVVLAMLVVAALLALSTAWLASRSRSELGSLLAVALPLFFLVVAAVQIAPIPAGLRAFLDPKGSALLSLAGLQGAQPLSLDPPETYGEFAKAAAALCVALAALVVASGRRLRFVAPGLIASAGLAAIAIGLGHRAAAEDKIFGHFSTGGGLLVGPFINPNHTAEFLEISAFAALAFSFARTTTYGQRVWKLIAAVLAAGAISTLSRGSVLALGTGALIWFVLAPASDQGEPLHRSRFVGMLLALVVVVGIAIGLGGDKIVDEFRGTASDNLSKLLVAKDALSLVLVHPAGIGLSAFSRVYPVYKTLHWPVWLQFVENQPVSILVETGIAGAVLLLGILLLVGRRFWQEARRDRVEASLLAGLVAILAHNVFDFGLETPGVLLPFCALLGTAFGRQSSSPAPSATLQSPLSAPRGEGQAEGASPKRRLPQLLAVFACVSAVVAIFLLSTPATRDFDALLQSPLSTSASRSLAQAASIAHPTDYAYALAEARLAPAATPRRLRLLNRAMILCPLCIGAHQEAARDLWRLGRRQQSLLEWKTVITESRPNLYGALDELSNGGAKPEELATLADNENRFAVSRYLLAHGALDVARSVLDQASNQENAELYLVQAQIALAAKDIPAAQKSSQRALELEPRNPSCALLAADLALLRTDGTSEAMAIIEKGLRLSPADVPLNRKHLSLLMQTEKWQAIDQALTGLRAALAETGAPSTEANINAAQIFEKRGQFRRAISEYQAALAHIPDNIGLRLSLARDAEQIGGIASAVDAYNDVLRRDPANPEARAALARIQYDKKTLEVDSILRAPGGAENK